MATRKKTTTKKRATKAVAQRSTKNAMALPDSIADEFADAISRDRATSVAATGWPIVRVSAQGFKLGGNPLPNPMPAIVLAGVRQNLLYEGAYNPSSPSSPTCAAVDLVGDETLMAPPPGGKSATCQECEFNAWGSGSGRGKACKNQVKLAIFPYGEEIDYTKGGKGAMLNLSPVALTDWSIYTDHITDDLGRPLLSVITNFEVEVLSQGFAVKPTFGGIINDPATLRALKSRSEGDAQKMLRMLPPLDTADPKPAPRKGRGGVTKRKIVRKK